MSKSRLLNTRDYFRNADGSVAIQFSVFFVFVPEPSNLFAGNEREKGGGRERVKDGTGKRREIIFGITDNDGSSL